MFLLKIQSDLSALALEEGHHEESVMGYGKVALPVHHINWDMFKMRPNHIQRRYPQFITFN